jgi:predicted NAD/FAD-binding protein
VNTNRADKTRRTIAVVGSGVAGLSAAYVLEQGAAVTLFESDNRLGGHAHTHELAEAAGRSVSVDTGFIVHNQRTYPTLLRLFAELDVATQESDMSMSVQCAGCGLEYAGGKGVSGLFPSFTTATTARYLRMLPEVLRFHRRAHELLAGTDDELTLSQFLTQGRFSAYFTAHFVTPVVSAVWSCAPSTAGEYPARYLFTFLNNHGMLSVSGSPTWRTVVGGSGRYVEKVAKQLTSVLPDTPVRSIRRTSDGVEIRDQADQVRCFDGVVIATHPGQALNLLSDASAAQQRTLGAISYTRNPTILHQDTSVLPKAARARASWNYRLPSCTATPAAVNLSYDMNRLQRLDTDQPYIVSLNSDADIDPRLVLDRMEYEHPTYTLDSVAARAQLPALNDGVVAFAGAYHGWGFHEDGCRSGVQAAASLGVRW